MIKVLAFDVSETLQTSAVHNDQGLGQPMIDQDGQVIPDAFSVLVGGTITAKLIKQAQEKGIHIVLVTNNGDDLDTEVVARTLSFLKKYDIDIPEHNYMGPTKGAVDAGSKVQRLEEILIKFKINKEELVFFDDSRFNTEEAKARGFKAIQVKKAEDLQNGVREVIHHHQAPVVDLTRIKEQKNQFVRVSLIKIDKAIQKLEKKIGKEEQHNYREAYLKAIGLLGELRNARNQYELELKMVGSDIKTASNTFQTTCTRAINNAQEVLIRDLGWGDYLKNLLKSLANAALVCVGATRPQLFFPLVQPASVAILEKAKSKLEIDQTNSFTY